MEFVFRYETEDASQFEISEAFGFAIEVNYLAKLVSESGLTATFIEEWFDYCQKVESEWPFPESSEPPDEEEIEAMHDAWDFLGAFDSI